MDSLGTIVVVVIVVIVLGLFVLFCWGSYLSSKCENCKKPYAYDLIKTEEIDRYNSTKIVKETIINKKTGEEKVVRNEVPVTRVVKLHTYKCKYCGHEKKEKSTSEL